MADDEIPDNAWDSEIRRRIAEGEDEEQVRDDVVIRSLNSGDPKPLVSAVIRGRPISRRLMGHVAAMLLDDESLPAFFERSYGSGRPSNSPEAPKHRYERALLADAAKLQEGHDPGARFWIEVVRGLYCGHPERWIGPAFTYPLRVQIRFRKLKHAPKKPDLDERNRLARWFVEKHVSEGRKKTAAIERVASDLGMSPGNVRRAVYQKKNTPP